MRTDQIEKIRDRNMVSDMFWSIKIGDSKMFNGRSIKHLVSYRFERRKKVELMAKVQLLKSLKTWAGFGHTIYIEIL